MTFASIFFRGHLDEGQEGQREEQILPTGVWVQVAAFGATCCRCHGNGFIRAKVNFNRSVDASEVHLEALLWMRHLQFCPCRSFDHDHGLFFQTGDAADVLVRQVGVSPTVAVLTQLSYLPSTTLDQPVQLALLLREILQVFVQEIARLPAQPLNVVFRLLSDEFDPFQDVSDIIDSSLGNAELPRDCIQVQYPIGCGAQQLLKLQRQEAQRGVTAGPLQEKILSPGVFLGLKSLGFFGFI